MTNIRQFQIEDRRAPGRILGLYPGIVGVEAIKEALRDPSQAPALAEMRQEVVKDRVRQIELDLIQDPFQARELVEELYARDHQWIDQNLDPFGHVHAFEVGSLFQRYQERVRFTVGQRMAGGEFIRDHEAQSDRFEGEFWQDGTGFRVWCTRPFGATVKECRLEAEVIDQRPSSTPVLPREPSAKISRKAS